MLSACHTLLATSFHVKAGAAHPPPLEVGGWGAHLCPPAPVVGCRPRHRRTGLGERQRVELLLPCSLGWVAVGFSTRRAGPLLPTGHQGSPTAPATAHVRAQARPSWAGPSWDGTRPGSGRGVAWGVGPPGFRPSLLDRWESGALVSLPVSGRTARFPWRAVGTGGPVRAGAWGGVHASACVWVRVCVVAPDTGARAQPACADRWPRSSRGGQAGPLPELCLVRHQSGSVALDSPGHVLDFVT